MKKIRLIIADDHEIVVNGLKNIFQLNDKFDVAGVAYSGTEAIEKTRFIKPDIVIMDIRMPGLSGIEACKEIKQSNPETNVIMLTSFADDDAIYASLLAGASGYVLKTIGSKALLEAVETVGRGQSLLDPAVTSKVINKMKQLSKKSTSDDDEKFTAQEKKVLALIVEGQTNRAIASKLFLSEKTVRNYVSSILHKLNFKTRSQIIVYGLQNKIN